MAFPVSGVSQRHVLLQLLLYSVLDITHHVPVILRGMCRLPDPHTPLPYSSRYKYIAPRVRVPRENKMEPTNPNTNAIEKLHMSK